MAKDPAVLFYTADFLSTTQGLTLDEIGALIKLLCIQHQTGRMTRKTVKIAVGEISSDVLSFFKTDENGLLYNERMEEEANKRKAFSESRRKNLRKRYEKESPTYVATSVVHMENANENVNINVNVNEIENEIKYGTFKNVILSKEEYEKLKEKHPSTYKKQIDNLSYYIESKGDKYKSHYATILSWERKNEREDGFNSFDTDDFFQAALERSSKRIKERSQRSPEPVDTEQPETHQRK